jgi:hypothetical protein
MTRFKLILVIIKARQRISYWYHGLPRFEEAKLIWKRVVPSHSSVSRPTKPVPGVIEHITIFRITAMLNATQIVPMPKLSILRIQNRQRLMSSDFPRNSEVRSRDATWNTRDARFKGVLLRSESTGTPSRSDSHCLNISASRLIVTP